MAVHGTTPQPFEHRRRAFHRAPSDQRSSVLASGRAARQMAGLDDGGVAEPRRAAADRVERAVDREERRARDGRPAAAGPRASAVPKRRRSGTSAPTRHGSGRRLPSAPSSSIGLGSAGPAPPAPRARVEDPDLAQRAARRAGRRSPRAHRWNATAPNAWTGRGSDGPRRPAAAVPGRRRRPPRARARAVSAEHVEPAAERDDRVVGARHRQRRPVAPRVAAPGRTRTPDGRRRRASCRRRRRTGRQARRPRPRGPAPAAVAASTRRRAADRTAARGRDAGRCRRPSRRRRRCARPARPRRRSCAGSPSASRSASRRPPGCR